MDKRFRDLENNYNTLLPSDKHTKILDFGCGTGRVLTFLHEKGYDQLFGADIDDSQFLELQKMNINTTKIESSVEYLKSVENTFDFIVAKDVVYYFDSREIEEIFKLLQKALKPNGKILFEIFNGSTFTGPYVKYKDIGIQLILTEHSLMTLIQNAGLKTLYFGGNSFKYNSLKGIVFSFLQFISRLILKLTYFSERGIDDQNPKILTRKVIALASK